MRLRFGRRTVPGLKLDGGDKISGSRAILRRLDELVPDPPLLPADPSLRAAVLDAERWDDDVLQALPGLLDRVDEWIAEGVIGGVTPNAADLQIGASLRLLWTIGDARPLLAGRPAEAFAMALIPDFAGGVPAGALPPDWLPAAPPNQHGR